MPDRAAGPPYRPDAWPQEVYLEVTNRCNLRCTTCPQSWGMEEAPADMTAERARTLLAQLPTVRRVVLHGIGEPTLNPELPEIVAAVKERGAYALFNTNGLLLRGRLSERLIASGLDEVRISIDAAEAATYREIRGKDLFRRVVANARTFEAARRRLGAATPKVSLWMTGLRTNVGELEGLVRLAAEVGIGEVYLQRLVFSGRGNAREELAVYGRLGSGEKDALRRAESLGRELGVVLRGSAEALPLETAPSAEEAPWRGCWRPFRLTYITANGAVLPCCIAPFTDAPYSGLVMGNAFRQPIAEVWEGERYRLWRERMTASEPNAACARCGSDWSL